MPYVLADHAAHGRHTVDVATYAPFLTKRRVHICTTKRAKELLLEVRGMEVIYVYPIGMMPVSEFDISIRNDY